MRYARRVDANHSEIVEALRAIGVHVADLSSMGKGCPDICTFYRGQTRFIEIKDGSKPPSKRKLTPEQVRFRHEATLGGVIIYVVTSVSEALAIFGAR